MNRSTPMPLVAGLGQSPAPLAAIRTALGLTLAEMASLLALPLDVVIDAEAAA